MCVCVAGVVLVIASDRTKGYCVSVIAVIGVRVSVEQIDIINCNVLHLYV